MVIDTAVVIAILLGEPGADRLVSVIEASPRRLIGTPTVVEAAAVMLGRKGPSGEIALDALLRTLDVDVVPMTNAAAAEARSAYARFGKGVGNPAVLNYGDCLAYGVAKSLGMPLLFKGDDFQRTDITAAPVGEEPAVDSDV